MKAYSVGGYSLHHWIKGAVRATKLSEADLILLPGGADIDPSWYGEPRGMYTGGRKEWDMEEVQGFKAALNLGIPIVGICRGEQLAGALSGARLIQHQRHPGRHAMYTESGNELLVNSLHHQAVYPYEMEEGSYKVLGWADNLSPMHLDGNDEEICKGPLKEVEAIYFPKTRSLGFQFHPEMMNYSGPYIETLDWCNEKVEQLLAKAI